MMSVTKRKPKRPTTSAAAMLCAALCAALLSVAPTSASARLPHRPMRWAQRGFAHHGEAVEHLTLRGADAKGNRTFIRFSLANAGYKKGKLTITVLQKTPQGTIYGSQHFKRGSYQIMRDRFGLQAGGNVMQVQGGKLVMRFQVGAVSGTAVLTPRGAGLALKDRGPSGWIRRDLLCPWGQLKLDLRGPKGLTAQLSSTVFAVHEASTIKAHRVYNHVVQLHRVRGGRATVVDYIVAPSERKHRALGFVILRGGGQRFVGPITREIRSAERVDRGNGYRVPWRIQVHAERNQRSADVELVAARQTGRKDDLAKLGFFTRKAVSLLIHPYTYSLAGTWTATVRSAAQQAATPAAPTPASTARVAAGAPPVAKPTTSHGRARYKYAQAR